MNNTKTFFENTIINNIDLESYDKSNDISTIDKINEVYKIFLNEYGFNSQRMSKENAFKEWLQGLPSVVNIPFYNYEIIENAKKEGFKLNKESLQDKFLSEYWMKLSLAFFTLKENL